MSEDRQYEATARRRQQAREKGQAPRSRDLSAAGVLLLATFLAPSLVRGISRHLSQASFYALAHLHECDLSREGLRHLFTTWGSVFFLAIAPLLAVVIVGSFLFAYLQAGLLVSTYPITPRLDKLNPFTSIKRMLSVQALVETLKSLLKVIVVGFVAWAVLRSHTQEVLLLCQMPAADATAVMGALAWEVTLKTAIALVIVGAADYTYQRFEHNKSLRMTREEMRQEMRETEGDPHVRGQRRQRREQLLRDGINARLPQASVVLANPTHVAVALYYEQGSGAPVVVARGRGKLAQRIKNLARRYGVPVREEPPLARALYQACPLGTQIPPALYRAVAVILAELYRQSLARRRR